jgi:hypothetical protein
MSNREKRIKKEGETPKPEIQITGAEPASGSCTLFSNPSFFFDSFFAVTPNPHLS